MMLKCQKTPRGWEKLVTFLCHKTQRVKYKFTEFFVFDPDPLSYFLALFFWSGATFPLVALDKILIYIGSLLFKKSSLG